MTFSIMAASPLLCIFFFQAEDGIRDLTVTGVQTCALPILSTLRFIPVLLIAGAVGASETVAQNPVPSVAPCLHYEPHVVRVTGKLVTEPHYGPPNFGETPDEIGRAHV